MNKHWLEAQQEALLHSGTNIVHPLSGNAVLVGNEELGWQLVTPQCNAYAQTEQGVQSLLEEFGIAPLGWA